MHAYIQALKANLKKNKIRGIALDIDDTLAVSGDYWIIGLQENFGNPENLSIDEIKEKYRYSYNAPYWNNPAVRNWEKTTRYDHNWHLKLPLIKNANHIVEEINKIVPIAIYLTARPKSIMPATKEWLEKYNFPKAPILYRPKDVKLPLSLAWKAKVLEYLYPQIVAMVDDHPQLAKDLSSKYPGTLYLYDYHDQAPRSDINIVPCKSWQEILEKLR